MLFTEANTASTNVQLKLICMLSTEDSTASTSFYLKAQSVCYLLNIAQQTLVFSLSPTCMLSTEDSTASTSVQLKAQHVYYLLKIPLQALAGCKIIEGFEGSRLGCPYQLP